MNVLSTLAPSYCCFQVHSIRTSNPVVSKLLIGQIKGTMTIIKPFGLNSSRRLDLKWFIVPLLITSVGCASGPPEVPAPRPIVIHSGARLRVEQERVQNIHEWVIREQSNIIEDPTFLVESRPIPEEVYLWQGLEIEGDTVRIPVYRGAPDAQLIHQIYAHLRLMVVMGRQEEWLPEAPAAVEYDLERAILSRAADAWLLGRTAFDTPPYGPLDELVYAKEAGYLDAFIFTSRPEEFATARTQWAQENPGDNEAYRDWFLNTFNRDPPGLRAR